MTYGKSDLLNSFLQAAFIGSEDDKPKQGQRSASQNGRVFVCETAPSFSGHATVKKLAESGIKTTVITDCSIYSLMSRIDKVIISCQAILANGGIIAPTGAYNLALAAKVSPAFLEILTTFVLFRNTQYHLLWYLQCIS